MATWSWRWLSGEVNLCHECAVVKDGQSMSTVKGGGHLSLDYLSDLIVIGSLSKSPETTPWTRFPIVPSHFFSASKSDSSWLIMTHPNLTTSTIIFENHFWVYSDPFFKLVVNQACPTRVARRFQAIFSPVCMPKRIAHDSYPIVRIALQLQWLNSPMFLCILRYFECMKVPQATQSFWMLPALLQRLPLPGYYFTPILSCLLAFALILPTPAFLWNFSQA